MSTSNDTDVLSKRKQLQKIRSSDKNKAASFPKIQSREQRERVHLRNSGLMPTTNPSKEPKLSATRSTPELTFCRALVSTQQRERHFAVRRLQQHLRETSSKKGVSKLDLMRLWKALWHTLYMADQPVVQERLADFIANLLWCFAGTLEEDEATGQGHFLATEYEEAQYSGDWESFTLSTGTNPEEVTDSESSGSSGSENQDGSEQGTGSSDDSSDSDVLEHQDEADTQSDNDEDSESVDDLEIRHHRGAGLVNLFVQIGFQTIYKEWGNCDKYRVDKFYTLIRYMMQQVFEYMAQRQWNRGIVRLFNDSIADEVLSRKPNGIRFHLIDIVLEELAKVNATAPLPLTEATYVDVMEYYFKLLQLEYEDDKLLQQRVAENVHVRFLEKYSVVATDPSDLIFDNVHVATIAQVFFDVGSQEHAKDEERKVFYDLHKLYKKQIKKAGKDVDLSVYDEEEDFPEDEVGEVDVGMVKALNEDAGNEVVYEADVDTPQKTNSLKKRKLQGIEDQGTSSTKALEEITTKKRKRKRKQVSVETDTDPKEETLTISVLDQKRAKAALKPKTGEPKSAESKMTSPEGSAGKKVKFGSVNHARSWKVSMRNLQSREIASPSDCTPEKGILREPKFTKVVKSKSKTKGKRQK